MVFWGSSISSKKQTNEFNFITMIPQVDLFLFVFGGNGWPPKKHFEINWPFSQNDWETLFQILRPSQNIWSLRSDAFLFHIYFFKLQANLHGNKFYYVTFYNIIFFETLSK